MSKITDSLGVVIERVGDEDYEISFDGSHTGFVLREEDLIRFITISNGDFLTQWAQKKLRFKPRVHQSKRNECKPRKKKARGT